VCVLSVSIIDGVVVAIAMISPDVRIVKVRLKKVMSRYLVKIGTSVRFVRRVWSAALAVLSKAFLQDFMF
jgi:hypothetical protein